MHVLQVNLIRKFQIVWAKRQVHEPLKWAVSEQFWCPDCWVMVCQTCCSLFGIPSNSPLHVIVHAHFCWGVRSGDELWVICIFDEICKQKIIHILNNTKKLLNSIVSFSAKLIMNDWTSSSFEITKKSTANDKIWEFHCNTVSQKIHFKLPFWNFELPWRLHFSRVSSITHKALWKVIHCPLNENFCLFKAPYNWFPECPLLQ